MQVCRVGINCLIDLNIQDLNAEGKEKYVAILGTIGLKTPALFICLHPCPCPARSLAGSSRDDTAPVNNVVMDPEGQRWGHEHRPQQEV